MIQYTGNIPKGFEAKIDLQSTKLGMPKFEVYMADSSLRAQRDSRNSSKIDYYNNTLYLGSEIIFSYDVKRYRCKDDYISATLRSVCTSLSNLQKLN